MTIRWKATIFNGNIKETVMTIWHSWLFNQTYGNKGNRCNKSVVGTAGAIPKYRIYHISYHVVLMLWYRYGTSLVESHGGWIWVSDDWTPIWHQFNFHHRKNEASIIRRRLAHGIHLYQNLIIIQRFLLPHAKYDFFVSQEWFANYFAITMSQ